MMYRQVFKEKEQISKKQMRNRKRLVQELTAAGMKQQLEMSLFNFSNRQPCGCIVWFAATRARISKPLHLVSDLRDGVRDDDGISGWQYARKAFGVLDGDSTSSFAVFFGPNLSIRDAAEAAAHLVNMGFLDAEVIG